MKQSFETVTTNAEVLGAVQMCVPFNTTPGSNLTLTNQVLAEQFLANSNRNITRVDLTYFNEVRIVSRVVTGSVSVNNPRLRVRYAIGFTTVVASYADIGTTEVAAALGTSGVADSGWISLVAAARADNVFVTVTQIGGDGVADPALGFVNVYFRNNPRL